MLSGFTCNKGKSRLSTAMKQVSSYYLSIGTWGSSFLGVGRQS